MKPLATIVSRHHEWRGPASYAPEDRDTCVCIDCGQRWRVGKENPRRFPRCKPKVEAAGSGYRGLPTSAYIKRHARDPERYPLPRGIIFIGEPA